MGWGGGGLSCLCLVTEALLGSKARQDLIRGQALCEGPSIVLPSHQLSLLKLGCTGFMGPAGCGDPAGTPEGPSVESLGEDVSSPSVSQSIAATWTSGGESELLTPSIPKDPPNVDSSRRPSM